MSRVLSVYLIRVLRIVVHYQVKIVAVRLVVRDGVKIVPCFHYKWMRIQINYDLQFSIAIAPILKHLFYRQDGSVLHYCFEDDAE